MKRFDILATDGRIGSIDDVYFDDERWAIRYLVADTGNGSFGKHVLVSPEWITDISWPERAVSVKITRQVLNTAPRYDRAEHLDRQWEAAYFQHLQQPGYWLTEDDPRTIKEARFYLRDEPDRHQAAMERRSRPR